MAGVLHFRTEQMCLELVSAQKVGPLSVTGWGDVHVTIGSDSAGNHTLDYRDVLSLD